MSCLSSPEITHYFILYILHFPNGVLSWRDPSDTGHATRQRRARRQHGIHEHPLLTPELCFGRSEVEWSGVKWSGVKWSGVE